MRDHVDRDARPLERHVADERDVVAFVVARHLDEERLTREGAEVRDLNLEWATQLAPLHPAVRHLDFDGLGHGDGCEPITPRSRQRETVRSGVDQRLAAHLATGFEDAADRDPRSDPAQKLPLPAEDEAHGATMQHPKAAIKRPQPLTGTPAAPAPRTAARARGCR